MTPKRVPARLATLAAFLLAALAPAAAAARGDGARSGPYEVSLVDGSGAELPTFRHGGRTWVLGSKGERYQVRVRNGTPRRIEVVVSVDGRDVLDGKPSDWGKRGYLVPAYGEVTIDGYRLDLERVAAFRFSSVPRSYAARMGDARDVGVVGVAVFPEAFTRPVPWEREYLSEEGAPAGDRGLRGEAPPAAKHGARSGAPAASAQAPAAAPEARGRALADAERERPGLGTEFGEERSSSVREVPFQRAGDAPASVLSLRYDDRRGLRAAGVDLDRAVSRADETWRREQADPFRRNGGFARPPPGWGEEWQER
jgi:hypothetical protein